MLYALLTVLALERTVLIDSTFSVADQGELVEAVEAWNYTFQGAVHLSPRISDLPPSDMASNAIILMRVDSSCTFIPTVFDGDVLAWTNQVGGNRVWFVRDRLKQGDVALVAMHELGHVFGAPDRDTPGLMYRRYTPEQYKCVDHETADVVGKFLGVTLRWCK